MIIKSLHWLCRLIVAGVFLYSGYTKVQNPLQFAVAISGYQLVPEDLVYPMAQYLPWVEIALGLGVLIGWKIRYFASAVSGLLFFFMSALTITYLRGIEANCGCFSMDDPISPLTIFRDSIFLIPALYLAFESRIRRRFAGNVLESSPSALDMQ
jgi:uncharacterized membrane protein YphA (DoxX/SURF4 family)